MDIKLLREIDYLTRLIQERKTMPPEELKNTCVTSVHNVHTSINMSSEFQLNNTTHCKGTNTHVYMKPLSLTTNVHVNPNFKLQNPVIHINPKVRAKPLIHVNPKMVKDVTNEDAISNSSAVISNSLCKLQQRDIVTFSACDKQSLIHVNPRMINNVGCSNESAGSNEIKIASDLKKNLSQMDVKQSVYVNPKLILKLSSIKQSKLTEKREEPLNIKLSINSRLKYVRKGENMGTFLKRLNVSNASLLPQRKTIRTKRNIKSYTAISQGGPYKVKKPVILPEKKSQTTLSKTTKHITTNSCTLQSISNKSNSLKPHNDSRYKIDRTVKQLTQVEKNATSGLHNTKYNSMELITIGGIIYKSSKNQLIRRSLSLKKKSSTTNAGNDKFIVTTNGRKLRRLKTTKEMNSRKGLLRATETKSGNSPKINYKTNISNKVKQRSIQILQNKMRKNNQPCLFFQRFGYCANQKNGICPKLHDKKQISVCKKFLQGKCLLDNCRLSHDVGPEKMPTCKYFLEACCMRDKCPYLHVKVSPNTPICIEFLKGYCAKGNECKRRHEYICPEFDKSEKCSKGKYCPYPHKTSATARQTTLQTDENSEKISRKKSQKETLQNESTRTVENNINLFGHECKLRYYENTDAVDKDLVTVKQSVMKKVQIMKEVEMAHRSGDTAMINATPDINLRRETMTRDNDNELQVNFEKKCSKRPPIGSLPAFIPIG